MLQLFSRVNKKVADRSGADLRKGPGEPGNILNFSVGLKK